MTPDGKKDISFTDEVPSGRAAIMVERSMYWNNRGAVTSTVGAFAD